MSDWGYSDHNGPDTWASSYPHAAGSHQSPVDISSSVVQVREFATPLKWRYEPGICKSVLNTGCGWKVEVEGGDTSELSGGPLNNSYELIQFHCHWGDTNDCGSEHTIDNRVYSGELHFVHWNKEEYSSFTEAAESPGGLAVLGVLLEEGDGNSEVEKLCQLIPQIPEADQRIDLPSELDVSTMFPDDHAFWTYQGSLTTPPCYESVTWLVFKNPITVSKEQLDCFRQLKRSGEGGEEDFVLRNYRHPQPLNDREICECL